MILLLILLKTGIIFFFSSDYQTTLFLPFLQSCLMEFPSDPWMLSFDS